jgi:hypothetical protein
MLLLVILTSSTPASTRLAPDSSAAEISMRTNWPAYWLMLQVPTPQAPLRSVAAPAWVNSVVVPPLWMMDTRKKSADEEFEPWARYHDRDTFRVPVDGKRMAGERTLVMPPSISKLPAPVPASRPVTRSFTPETVVPSCLVPLDVVVCGSPRSHAPVVAVSVPLGLVVQPVAVSKVSE